MEAMFNYGFWSCIPIIVLIAGILITKRVIETMIVAILVGTVMCYKQDFFIESINLAKDTIGGAQYQGLLLLVLGFGALTVLFEKSGEMLGFNKVIRKFAKTKRSAVYVISNYSNYCLSFGSHCNYF